MTPASKNCPSNGPGVRTQAQSFSTENLITALATVKNPGPHNLLRKAGLKQDSLEAVIVGHS